MSLAMNLEVRRYNFYQWVVSLPETGILFALFLFDIFLVLFVFDVQARANSDLYGLCDYTGFLCVFEVF